MNKKMGDQWPSNQLDAINRYRLERLVKQYTYLKIVSDKPEEIIVSFDNGCFAIPLANPDDAKKTARFYLTNEVGKTGLRKLKIDWNV